MKLRNHQPPSCRPARWDAT